MRKEQRFVTIHASGFGKKDGVVQAHLEAELAEGWSVVSWRQDATEASGRAILWVTVLLERVIEGEDEVEPAP